VVKAQKEDSRRSSIASFPPRAQSGRPLVQAPTRQAPSVRGRKVSPTAVIQAPSSEDVNYRESGSRWLERQEAHALREALETMDKQEEEKRIHKAAQDEAADLVWRHRNPKAAEAEKVAAYRNPDIVSKNRFKAHLDKGAHARSQSHGYAELGSRAPKSHSSRTVSDSSDNSQGLKTGSAAISESKNNTPSGTLLDLSNTAASHPEIVPSLQGSGRRRSSGQRNASNGSSKGVFRNPTDQIFEEPDEAQAPFSSETIEKDNIVPLKARHRNSLPRGSRPLPQKSATMPLTMKQKVDRFEIHKNPPTQSRNAAYTINSPTPPVIPEVDTPPPHDNIETRGEDIRAATTMRKKDRSPNLPTPTAVSDRLGRPIVSFDPAWTPSPLKVEPEQNRPIPAMTMSAPIVPTINLPSDDKAPLTVPVINIPDDHNTPAITVSQPDSTPVIQVSGEPAQQRPVPKHSHTSPPKLSNTKTSTRLPWLNPTSRSGIPTVTCINCALPISGRIVTASGSSDSSPKARFHPECFTCYHCSTSLECVAFYPEPANKRLERLAAEAIDPDSPEADLRFYCHLDFHEFFSPRCRSCKTPIEGEVIVAAGGEWHPGHFFCGECGDPFDSNTPFVEKDGYAYCVSCHTKRTSARCRACKKQILDELTVEALGGTWHEECFVCLECAGGFGEEGRYFVREVEVEGTEKERRRGIMKKIEERAVCEGCEGRRLKA
jgi:LIM domain